MQEFSTIDDPLTTQVQICQVESMLTTSRFYIHPETTNIVWWCGSQGSIVICHLFYRKCFLRKPLNCNIHIPFILACHKHWRQCWRGSPWPKNQQRQCCCCPSSMLTIQRIQAKQMTLFYILLPRFSAGSAVWNPTLSRDTRHSILLLRPLKLSTQVSLPQKLLAELMRVVFCGPRDTLWSHDFHHKTKYRSWPSQGVVLLMVATSKTRFIAPNSIQDLSKLEDVPKAEILRRRSSFSYFQQIDQATTCSGHPYSCLLHPPLHLHLRSLSFSWWIQNPELHLHTLWAAACCATVALADYYCSHTSLDFARMLSWWLVAAHLATRLSSPVCHANITEATWPLGVTPTESRWVMRSPWADEAPGSAEAQQPVVARSWCELTLLQVPVSCTLNLQAMSW